MSEFKKKLRNYEITDGLLRFSKARMYHKRGLFQKLKKPFQAKEKKIKPVDKYETKKVGGDKNGGERKILLKKKPKYLSLAPTIAKKIKRRPKTVPLRQSISPGVILIILSGRHRGKRVVFLRQLKKSGLLLVTGPLTLNATPMRRIAQAFVIATKTRIDISSLQIPEHINDDYFKRPKKSMDKSKSGIFATGEKETKYTVSDQRKSDQKQVDAAVLSVIRSHPEKKFLFGYLGSRFSLTKNQHPHKLVF